MSQYYGNQTSDLSASMTSSSIASDVQEMSSVACVPHGQTNSVENYSKLFGPADIGKTFGK